MVDISRGTAERVQEEVETENMSPAQRRQAVKEVLDEMDKELTATRYSDDEKIGEERNGILEIYTERVLDLVE